MFKHRILIGAFAAAALLFSSCGMPKDIVYVQNSVPEEVITLSQNNKIVAQPNDELSIIVSSKDPELASMFNLPLMTYGAGRKTLSYTQDIATYNVNAEGYITFPILGKIHVVGLTRDQIAQKITDMLVSNALISDPVVIVDFINHYFSVTGEVSKPGRFAMDRDQVTILEGLAQAGDLTIYGKRPNVKVMRITDGKEQIFEVDLTDVEKLTSSPAYFLQQNDVIYVSPNSTRGRQANVNGNNLLNYSFWLSLASVLTSMAVLIFK